MSELVELVPKPLNQRASLLLVVALVYDGLCTFEFGIASEVFGLKRPELFKDGFLRLRACQ